MELICPECKKQSKTSQLVKIFYGYGDNRTVNMYVDESGIPHSHNRGYQMNIYECSNGHHLRDIIYHRCYASNCEFSGGTSRLEVMDEYWNL